MLAFATGILLVLLAFVAAGGIGLGAIIAGDSPQIRWGRFLVAMAVAWVLMFACLLGGASLLRDGYL